MLEGRSRRDRVALHKAISRLVRQDNGKRAAAARLAFDLDAAPMTFGYPVCDHETEPGATSTRLVCLPESVEEMWDVVRRDSNTGVFHPKSN